MKKIIAAFLAVLLMTTALPMTAFATQKNTPKEEVAYINLKADGSVKEINIVNIFDLNKKGTIIDYGKYENLRNMTTTDAINYKNDTVTIDAGTDKLYYEGKLKSSVMPWAVSIKYFMDGKEYTADKIAGMSGKLEIKMWVQQNKKCDSSFFKGYALQAVFTLDTGKAANITAEGATIANVGSDKQLTYTVLPGKGAEIDITADVTDFEMDSVAINGIPLNLNIEVDDAKLMGRVAELQEAIKKLDNGTGEVYKGVSELKSGVQSELKDGVSKLKDGASKLKDGASQLQNGGNDLQSGAADLKNGAYSLDKGIKSLSDGIVQVQNALNALNSKSKILKNGSSKFKDALGQLKAALDGISANSEDLPKLIIVSSYIKSNIDKLVSGIEELKNNVSFASYKASMGDNGLNIEELKESNTNAASSLSSAIANLESKVSELRDAGADTSALESQIKQLKEQNLATLLQANNASIAGMESYLNSVNSKLSELLTGATKLQAGYSEFDSKITELVDTLSKIAYNMSSLSTAINSLVSAYSEIDKGIGDYTDAVAQIVAGYSKISGGAERLVTGSSSMVNGTQSLYDGTGELLSGIEELYNGTGTLYDGSGELDEGVKKLLVGVVTLYNGTGELRDGTSTFKKKTDGMDTEIRDKIDKLLESITGGDLKIHSFVSSQNTEVHSVQFVIQTEKIQIEKSSQTVTEKDETLNFWQKFLKLFGCNFS